MNMFLLIILLIQNIFCNYKYLGVERYGTIDRKEVLNPESKIYIFSKDNQEYKFSIYPGNKINETDTGPNYEKFKCEDGAFPIQNKLVEGFEYKLTLEGDKIIDVEQITKISPTYKPPVDFTPGLQTLKNFLLAAFQPVGTTLYVFGGGWDFQDVGSANEARTIGISPNWVDFFDKQDGNYNYKDEEHKDKSYYPFNSFNQYYYAGLDCSGYVGWSVYNNLHKENLLNGYVTSATNIGKTLAEKNYGLLIHPKSNYTVEQYILISETLKPGDILCIKGHVMIVLGRCDDGSFVIFHSTPSLSKLGSKGGGVQISAVNPKNNGSPDCQAYKLCKYYMEKYFKKWSERYEVKVCLNENVIYFDDDAPNTGVFHWDLKNGIIKDPDNYVKKTAKEILEDIFKEKETTDKVEPGTNIENDNENNNHLIAVIVILAILLFVALIIIGILIIKYKKVKKSVLEGLLDSNKETNA